jgi:hypothetical protein
MDFGYYETGSYGYWEVADRYGEAAADAVAEAAARGDTAAVNNALSNARRGTTNADYAGSTSTLGNLWTQLTTDPLAAPLDAANTQISRAIGNVFKNPFVLLTVLAVIFFALGGWQLLERQMARR